MDEDYTINSGEENAPNELDELFAAWASSGAGQAAAGAGRSEAPIPMPDGFSVSRTADVLTIERRWYSPAMIAMAGFAVFWLVFVGAFSSMVVGSGGVLTLFMVPFWAAGLGLAYIAAANLVNRTYISVQAGNISVQHKPMPWMGTLSLPANTVSQLYTREIRRVRTRSGSGGSITSRTGTRVIYTYDVMVVYGEPTRESRLVRGLSEPRQARFIEYTVEAFLGIEDRPIRGELRRDE